MKEFLLIFRADYKSIPPPSAEQYQAIAKRWGDWINSVTEQQRTLETGKRMHATGKVVRANNVVTDGPYTEIKETLGGYCFITAESMDEAVALSKGCPVIGDGGNVEIRELI